MRRMTPEEFLDSLRERRPDVWVRGNHVPGVADEPLPRPVVNAPTPEDVASPENAELIAKYLVGRPGVTAEERIDMARLLQDLTASGEAGWYAVISAHGGGSPEALRMSAVRNYDLSERQALARRLACFAKSEDDCEGCGSCGEPAEVLAANEGG